jgi:uncharacterized protein (DUF885 family)
MIDHTPPLTRRTLLASMGGVSALTALPATLNAMPRDLANGQFTALLDSFANEMLQLAPETATSLGVDNGANAGLRSQLGDASAAGDAKWLRQVASMQTRLAHVNRAALGAAQQIRYDTLGYALNRGRTGAHFFYGSAESAFSGRASPYVINQQGSAALNLPEFLNAQHKITTVADCEAYVARVAEFARVIDQETEVLRDNAGRGVVPPSFIAANALGQLKGYRAVAPGQQPLVESLVSRAKASGISGDWAARVTGLVATKVYPALDRQIAAFEAATRNASDVAGVGKRLPQGDAYYHWALSQGTTTTQTPAEVHKIGLDQNRELIAKMDALLKAQGLSKGTVGARLQALNKDPQQLYPDTAKGRDELIAYLNDRVGAIRPMLTKISHMPLKADLVIKRVPADIQDGAPLGYMNFAALDGSRPATYYVNLKSTSLWPKYQLPTLTAHEGIPGHTWQGAYLAEHHTDVPLITSMMQFNAFIEGWALYAEQIAEEHGLYADDPLGRIGYLQAQQFRACRMVVDTGLHAMGWTRQQSINFLADQTGRGVAAMTSETDRYCAWPGQACGYKTGHNEILRLRAKAARLLGGRFDLAAFDDVVVQTGGVPLTILAQVVDRYITSGSARAA